MKRALMAAVAALAMVMAAQASYAISFSVDVPVQFNYTGQFLTTKKDTKPKDRQTGDVNGFILGASVGWVGLGYENYDVKGKGRILPVGGPTSFNLSSHFQLYDVFFDLPIPFLHPQIGYGAGNVTNDITVPNGTPPHVQNAPVSQTFLRLGFPLGPLFKLDVGYNHLTAQDAKLTGSGTQGGGNKLNSSGDTFSAGIRVGW